MKYRKKPVVIEAFQLTEDMAMRYFFNKEPLPLGLLLSGSYNIESRKIYDAYATIETLEGKMTASLGDWIITGIQGEHYPCKPDIFAATYEPAASGEE